MRTEKEYPVRLIVTVQERQKNKSLDSKSFTVYDSNLDEVFDVVKKAIEENEKSN